MAVILVVEDELDLRALFRIALEGAGHNCVEAKNGHEGLEMAKSLELDLIVTDHNMPRMTGFQMASALSALRKKGAEIPPILLVSGGTITAEIWERHYQNIFADRLLKPVDLQDLIKKVNQILSQAKIKRIKH